MFIRLCLCLFHFFITTQVIASYRYDLSVCMIFRNEAPYLKEWIEFHRLLGVDHFFLYSNLSEDNYQEVLKPYVKSGVVELFEWNQESNSVHEWHDVQFTAYNDALKRAKIQSKWLAILDSDEFLFPTQENNLVSFLNRYEKLEGFGGLLVNWVLFGTSSVAKIPDNQLLIETLVRSETAGNHQFKSISLTKRMDHISNAHFPQYKAGYRAFSPNNHYAPFVEIEDIRINHYWSRDEWYLNHFKIPRRALWGTDSAICKQWAEQGNEGFDGAILRFVEPLRKAMNEVQE